MVTSAPCDHGAVRLPFGMSYQQWQAAITAGWLGMDATAAARLGVKAAWKEKAAAA